MKQVWLAAGCVAGAILLIGSKASNGGFSPRRRLDMSFHLSTIGERDVIPLYDTSQLQFMSSPCRPESDGYFGSTSGSPLEIQYGFELETEDEENVEFLLEEIDEQVIDTVLSSTFPNLCGFRRRQQRGRNLGMRGLSSSREIELKAKPRTTGFKFGMDLTDRSAVCTPAVDPTNLCGVYKNTIEIYGRHLSGIGSKLLLQVKETLSEEQKRLEKDGLVRLAIVESLTVQTGDYGSQPSGLEALSFAAKSAIVIVLISLMAGAATFIVYVYFERRRIQQQRPYIKRDKKNGSNRTLGCEEEVSQVSEKVGLRDGTAVVLEDGRPVVIEFDKISAKRHQKDAIEEERSSSGSTIYSVGSASPQYVPRGLRTNDNPEESKEPEGVLMDCRISDRFIRSAVPVASPMASMSEYTDDTAKSPSRKGELI